MAFRVEIGSSPSASPRSDDLAPATVREVLREDQPRYRIEWDDGHASVYAPAAGALHREHSSVGASS